MAAILSRPQCVDMQLWACNFPYFCGHFFPRSWWRHGMETHFALLMFSSIGIYRSPAFPTKGNKLWFQLDMGRRGDCLCLCSVPLTEVFLALSHTIHRKWIQWVYLSSKGNSTTHHLSKGNPNAHYLLQRNSNSNHSFKGKSWALYLSKGSSEMYHLFKINAKNTNCWKEFQLIPGHCIYWR